MSETQRQIGGYRKADPARPAVVRAEEWTANWDAPGASSPGMMRGICRGLEGTNVAVGMVIIPAGQTTPPHDYSGEHFIYQLRGATRFVIDDAETVVRPGDALFIPANVVYHYGSVGLDESVFVNILGRLDDWPGVSRYV
ncbi:hypothetical protein JCM18899A_38350 [Nocardioides sp. AN3]